MVVCWGQLFLLCFFPFWSVGSPFLRVVPISSFFTRTGNMRHSLLFLIFSPTGRSLLFDKCFIVRFGSFAFGYAYSLAVSGAHFRWLLFPFFSVLLFDLRYPCYFIFGFRLLEVSIFPVRLWFFPFWNISLFVPCHYCTWFCLCCVFYWLLFVSLFSHSSFPLLRGPCCLIDG